jgi:hypothetical protein
VAWKLSAPAAPMPAPTSAAAPRIVAERAEDGKLRCTCATWDDAVVVLKNEALTLVNIERQVHALRTKAPPVVKGPPAAPDLGDGKLRCTCTTWDDAVVMLRGEALTLVNIERQVPRGGPDSCEHRAPGATLGAKAPADVVQTPRRHPRSREDDFGAPLDDWGGWNGAGRKPSTW